MAEPFRYLAFKNWTRYQSGKKGWDWIKDYVNQNDDDELSKLSLFERGLLQELRRLRGRSGKNIRNDVTYIAGAIQAKGTDRSHIGHALDRLIEGNILVLTNQQHDYVDEMRGEEKRREEKEITVTLVKAQETGPKPVPFTPQDLAPNLLQQMGIGLSAQTANAAIEALRMKASQPGNWDAQLACLHIVERWNAYKSSPVFKTQYKKSAVKWLIEGCYDDPPESWQQNGNAKVHVTAAGQSIGRGYIPPKKKSQEIH